LPLSSKVCKTLKIYLIVPLNKIQVYIENIPIDIERISDYFPILLRSIHISTERLILEGIPWYFEKEPPLEEVLLKEESDISPPKKPSSRSKLLIYKGNVLKIISHNDELELILNIQGSKKQLRFKKQQFFNFIRRGNPDKLALSLLLNLYERVEQIRHDVIKVVAEELKKFRESLRN